MEIRDAVAGDSRGITAIYNDAVMNGRAIWNETAVDVANRAQWIADHQRDGLPVLVAVEDGVVLGYASYGPYRNFDGYRKTVENSVYIRRNQQGKGVGKALMIELLNRARAGGMHVMIAAIEGSNTGSIALHEKLGFERVGLLKEVGSKFGEWLDLVFLEIMFEEEAPR
ncbi:MAG: GNAT family N-acetyltransferase [Ancrocorticia sp.]|uniref:GNAT family N-acetyltransferase n=1 Tax=Ancrocorticia sp. TaxID=2593684 RepID=UPI003F8E69E3